MKKTKNNAHMHTCKTQKIQLDLMGHCGQSTTYS